MARGRLGNSSRSEREDVSGKSMAEAWREEQSIQEKKVMS